MLRVAFTTTALVAASAHAFSVGTIATRGCHEEITERALASAGVVPDEAHVTAADRELKAALLFSVHGPWDRATLALLLGARNNDFHGANAGDLLALSSVHMAPDFQREHCLRSPGEDGTDGDRAAIADCRAFISAEVRTAMLALPGATETVSLALADETRTVELPTAAFHLGQALHALEDGFSHTLRSADFRTVRSVFNYVDPNVGAGYLPARDGHAHASEFDSCAGFPVAERRADAAVSAAAELVRLTLIDSASVEVRLASVEATLDHVWNYQPVCGPGVAWCPEAEAEFESFLPPVGCAAAPGLSIGAVLVVMALALRRRARAAALPCALALVAPLSALASESPASDVPGAAGQRTLTVAGATATESSAPADDTHLTAVDSAAVAMPATDPSLPTADAGTGAPPADVIEAAQRPELRVRPTLSLGFSIERVAGLVGVGARLPVSQRVELYASLELNPWADLLAGKVNLGAVNASLGAFYRWATVHGFELRSGLGAGLSVLAHDTVASRAGAVGPFLNLSVLNVVVPLAGSTRLEVTPEVVLAVPSLRGVPLVYHEYRMALTVRFD